MKSQEAVRATLADVAVQDLPSTSNKRLDEALDGLPVEGQAAALALLERYGQDGTIDAAKRRLAARVEPLTDPEILRETCIALGDADLEDRLDYWLTYLQSWRAAVVSL
jgi:hypothetical protein